ncbi:MAG: hypothetical protein SA339_12205 [Methanomassiliicoccus sp.]|nr:hypothetical protein [Methanomassiliicoccus sp.]
MDKNFRIWVELASKKRRCSRCTGDIGKGVMFVRMGNRDKVKGAACMCATCFETVMSDLSDEYNGMKAIAHPTAEVEQALEIGPKCFSCGLPPERCRCAREAYR